MPSNHLQPSAVLTVQHLTKTFGALTALHDVSFSVHAGEVLGLIGPNGSGKTTLFQCVAGLLPRDTGVVTVATPLFYLPDGIAPWPAQTVHWALSFVIDFFRGDRATLHEVIARLKLTRLLDQRIGTLSKGERKRTLLALGLVVPHPVLLADEPFDGLDLKQTQDVAGYLRSRAQAGRTLFLSIHQIADAARVCDRFVLLSEGRVCGQGTLADLSALAAERTGTMPQSLDEAFLALT